jgi:hypothetical protein
MQIIQRIVVAFGSRTLPRDVPVFETYYFEVDTKTLESLARRTSAWLDLPRDVLAANPLALAFMSPEAFAWFLPAYLVTSVERYFETDTLTSSIITHLTLPDEEDGRQFELSREYARTLDFHIEEPPTNCFDVDDKMIQEFMDRVANLSRDERAAVRDYLEYVDSEHGEDFLMFGPKQALERYWAQCCDSIET